MQDNTTRLGEVVETSTTGFVAQCYQLYGAPPLGALVKAGGLLRQAQDRLYSAYGVVSQVSTQGIDPSRRPVARGQDETNEEDVYRSNPQLAHLLRTDFQAVIVGHGAGGEVRYYLPPVPPPIYAFVHTCGVEEVRLFTSNPAFLRPLATSSIAALEEVVAACLRYAASAHEDPTRFLAGAGKQLAGFFPGDFRRVEAILQRASP
ncbi:MAG: hypothetical protein HY672_02760 [Chloroflexi bacterium]|nr:hypothetical protein [Chloroflexota bacterium]